MKGDFPSELKAFRESTMGQTPHQAADTCSCLLTFKDMLTCTFWGNEENLKECERIIRDGAVIRLNTETGSFISVVLK